MKILGDYHTHTYYSDGRDSVMEMVRAAKEKGLQEIAITDHSLAKSLGGLRRRNIEKIIGEIESAKCELPVLFGVESNVVSVDGHIDVPADLAEKLDILLFGVHTFVWYSLRGIFTFLIPNLFWNMIRHTPRHQVRKNTEIVRRVIEKNNIDIWTHPSRYFKVDVVEIARCCLKKGTLIELNSKRISFRPVDFERMAALGCKFIINSDAHSTNRVGDISRIEEFLKNCDYDPACIINLNQTFTEYKKGIDSNDTSGTDKNGNQQEPKQKRPGKFGRWF